MLPELALDIQGKDYRFMTDKETSIQRPAVE